MAEASIASAFEMVDETRSRVVGLLGFNTVAHLLTAGSAAIAAGRAQVIDLSAVTGSDSSGLALLIEWMSIAHEAGRTVRYENMPVQLHQLARLSEVEELLIPPPVAAI
jgi:phospholipid transport system transporter-binding protein